MRIFNAMQPKSVQSRVILSSTAVILTLVFLMTVVPAMNRSAGAEVPTWRPNSSVDVPEFPIARNWRRYLEFIPTLEQDKLLYTATQAGIAKCMADAGYQYSQGRYIDDRWMDEFNPLNSEWASQFGYHVPTVEEEQPSNTGEGQPAGFAEKLEGDCAKEGWAKTYNAEIVSQYVALVDEVLNSPSGIMATTDRAGKSAVIGATGLWSKCMAEKGVKASRPDDLLNIYSGKGTISEEELRVRLLDIGCDKDSGLTANRSNAERTALEQWLSSNSSTIEKMTVLRTGFDNYVSTLR